MSTFEFEQKLWFWYFWFGLQNPRVVRRAHTSTHTHSHNIRMNCVRVERQREQNIVSKRQTIILTWFFFVGVENGPQESFSPPEKLHGQRYRNYMCVSVWLMYCVCPMWNYVCNRYLYVLFVGYRPRTELNEKEKKGRERRNQILIIVTNGDFWWFGHRFPLFGFSISTLAFIEWIEKKIR